MKSKTVCIFLLLIAANTISAQTIKTKNIGNSINFTSDSGNSKAIYHAKAYAINSSDHKLERIDLVSGAVDTISSIPPSIAPVALAFVDSALYCLSITSDINLVLPNGTFSSVGTITGLPPSMSGTIPIGLAYDYTSGITYLTTIDLINNISALYTLNMNTMAATFIGNIINKQIYSIEIDNEGNMLAICATNDSIYQVNKETGLGIPLGALGVSIDNKSQDMAWNFENSTLFAILYDDSGNGEFGTMNTSSGLFSEVVNYPAKQYSGLAINKYYISTTGIDKNEKSNLFVYPNPASTFITVNSGNVFTKITITDNSGKVVLEQNVSSVEQICISGLTAGLYLATLSNHEYFKNIKLVIE